MKVGDLCDRDVPRIRPLDPVNRIEKQLVQNRYLAIFDKDVFKGLLTMADMVQNPYKIAIDCVTPKNPIDAGLSFDEALKIMEASSQNFLPVFEKNVFRGVLSYKALLHAIFQEHQEIKQELYQLENYKIMNSVTSGFVHDFNNILMVIQANMSLLLMTREFNDELVDTFDVIKNGVNKAKNLMKRLSRHDQKFDIHKEPVDLHKYLQENTRFYLKFATNIRVHFDFPADLDKVELDPTRFSQVLSNLVVNACQAMPEGGQITIRALNHSPSPEQLAAGFLPGRYVRISIQDTGPGIPPETLSQLFTPYFTTKPTGNGLGLSVSRQIVEGHQGRIAVSSQPGKGTVFDIYLPSLD